MSSRLLVVLGLLLGAVSAVALFVGAAILVPDAALPIHTPTPSDFAVRPSANSPPSASPGASLSGSAAISASPSGGGSATANFHVGQPAPRLVVNQVGGGTIDLSTLKGKAVWVNFMATTCPSCRDEFPLMNGYAARYANAGLVVIAVDVREDEGMVASFAQSLNATFPIGLDADGSAQKTWQAYALPVHFWVGKDGIVRDGSLGGIGPDIMVPALRKILPGVDIKP